MCPPRRKRIALLAVAALGLAAFLWLLAARPPDLEERAKPFYIPYASEPTVGYYDWLSMDEILLFRRTADRSEEIFRFHRRQDRLVPLPALNTSRYVPPKGGGTRYWPFERSLSPDRQRLYWEGKGEQTCLVSPLSDTQRLRDIEFGLGGIQLVWQKDSKHLAYLRPPAHPGEEASLHLFSLEVPPQEIVARIHGLHEEATLVSFLDDTHLLAVDPEALNTKAGRLVLKRYSFGPLTEPPQTILCPVPADAIAVRELRLSPTGDRLAWFMDFERQASYPPWAQRVRWQFFDTERCNVHTGLWISRIDGTEVRELGRIVRGGPEGFGDPAKLRWLPDEKSLSFGYKGTWWTIPVDL